MNNNFNEEAAAYATDLLANAGHPVGAPDPNLARTVRRVGVVGAGVMAAQIAALVAASLDVPVVMRDVDQDRVDAGMAHVHQNFERQIAKQRLTADQAHHIESHISASTALSVFADCDVVIEAVTENLAVKRAVFTEIEHVVSPDTVLCTNTSALSVTAMAEGLNHPERVVGLHFFNPVAAMPLVEVVQCEGTDARALATTFAVARGLGKTAVLSADRPGFIVNRLLCLVIGETLKAIEAGTPAEKANAALDPLGLPMRPLELLALVGIAVGQDVLGSLNAKLGDRYPVPVALTTIVEEGIPLVGKPAQRGEYGRVNPRVQEIFDESRKAPVDPARAPDAPAILEGTLSALTREIGMMLEEGVITAPEQVDLAMLLGANWPKMLGGITPYLDHSGYSQRVLGMRLHPTS